MSEPDDESLSVGRIGIQEFREACEQGRDIFAERVEKRIGEILKKYDCQLVVKKFNWSLNGVEGEIGVVRRQPEP